jgi:hypothetical protein
MWVNILFYATFDVRRLFHFMEGVGLEVSRKTEGKTQGLGPKLFAPQ